MKILKYFVGSILIILLFAVPGTADEFSEPAQYLLYTPGGRALSLGGAFVSIADDSSATFYNPAGLIQLKGSSGELFISMLDLDRSYRFISYAAPLTRGSKFMSGGYIMQYVISDIIGHDELGFSTGTFSVTSTVVSFSAAYQLSKVWGLGLNLKMLEQDFRENKGDTYGFDFGLFYGVNQRLKAGLVFRDISESFSWETGYIEDVPMLTQIGASYQIDRSWKVAVETSMRKDGDAIPHMGVEYSAGDFNGALGYSDSLISAGLGGNFKVGGKSYLTVNIIYKTEKEGFKPQWGFSVGVLTK